MQVIIAVQAKMRLFADDDVDIALSDHSINADKRAEGLKKTGLFRRVKYIKTKGFCYNPSKTFKLFDAFSLLFKDNKYLRQFWDDDFDYDKIFFYNPNLDVCSVINAVFKDSGRKKIPETVRFEEGVSCYSWLTSQLPKGRAKIVNFLNRLRGLPDIFRDTKKYMCFYPDVLRAEAPKGKEFSTIQIPFLTSDKDFLANLNTIFDYDPSASSFTQKYIYFATSADIDGHPVGETEIILQLSELVGKDNLLVKVHPRDDRDVFERAGLTVSRNSALPWEVMQLNHDFTKHVFISLSSGSTINITAMKNENIPVFMLFPLVAGKDKYMDSVAYASIRKTLEDLQALGVCKSVKITGKLGDVIM